MKIIDKAKNSTTTFRDIKTESIFKLNDKILMKICSIGNSNRYRGQICSK